MSGFAFSPQRVAELRRKPGVAAILLPLSESVIQDRVRFVYREFKTHDADGRVTGVKRERIRDVAQSGELKAARLTVLLVEEVDVYGIDEPWGRFKLLDLEAARACGFRTVLELRDDWKDKHPHMDLAQLAWFSLGDVRDKDRYLQRWISRGGDYTQDRHLAVDELPALSPEELEAVAANNHQRHTAQQAQTAARLADEPLADRVARIEAVGGEMRKELKNELAIIAERAKRGLKKLVD